MRKNHSIFKIIFAAALAAVLALAVIPTAFSRYVQGEEKGIAPTITDFEIWGDVYFQNGVVSTPAQGSETLSNYFEVNLFDELADNYIGKLRVDVQYKSITPILIRVSPQIQIVENDANYVRCDTPLFAFDEYDADAGAVDQPKWFDHSKIDSFYYYATQVHTSDYTSFAAIPFILGPEADYVSSLHDGQIAYIKVIVEGVQINRYPQFWHVDPLPWKTA